MFKIKKTSAALPYYLQFAVVNAVNILITIKPVDPVSPSKRNEGAAQLPSACLEAIRTREPTLMFQYYVYVIIWPAPQSFTFLWDLWKEIVGSIKYHQRNKILSSSKKSLIDNISVETAVHSLLLLIHVQKSMHRMCWELFQLLRHSRDILYSWTFVGQLERGQSRESLEASPPPRTQTGCQLQFVFHLVPVNHGNHGWVFLAPFWHSLLIHWYTGIYSLISSVWRMHQEVRTKKEIKTITAED